MATTFRRLQIRRALSLPKAPGTYQMPVKYPNTGTMHYHFYSLKNESRELVYGGLRRTEQQREYYATWSILYCNIDTQGLRQTPNICSGVQTWKGESLVLSASVIYSQIRDIVVWSRQKWIFGLYCPHRLGRRKCRSYVSKIMSSISHEWPTLAGLPGQRRIKISVRKKYYPRQMTNEVYATVIECRACSRNEPTENRRRPPQLFPAIGPLGIVAMVILRRPFKALNGNQVLMVMTNCLRG